MLEDSREIPVIDPSMPPEDSSDDTAHSLFTRAGRSHFPVLFGEHASRGHVGDGSLQLVLPSAYDVPFSLHHCLEAGLGASAGSSFFAWPTFVSSMSARSKKSVSVA